MFRRHLPDPKVCELSLVSRPSPEVQKFCNNNGIQLPLIVPSDGFWGEHGPPTFHQVYAHAWKAPRKGNLKLSRLDIGSQKIDLRVFERGALSAEASVLAPLAFSQLVHPDARNPVSIIGIDFPELLSRWKFGSCAELHRYLTTTVEQNPVINITPQYSHVDLHIGKRRPVLACNLSDKRRLRHGWHVCGFG